MLRDDEMKCLVAALEASIVAQEANLAAQVRVVSILRGATERPADVDIATSLHGPVVAGPEFLTTRHIAERYRCSSSTVRRVARAHGVAPITGDGWPRYDRRKLDPHLKVRVRR